jgi:hypothetical protein
MKRNKPNDTGNAPARKDRTVNGHHESNGKHIPPINRVFEALRTKGIEPTGGNGQWKSRCPLHNGKSPNLSIKEVEDGTVVINCHHVGVGGELCDAKSIVHALDLTMADLFPLKSNGHAKSNGKAPKSNGKPSTTKPGFATLDEAVAWNYRANKATGKQGWKYTDDFWMFRFNIKDKQGNPDKTFLPFRRDPDGWQTKSPDDPRPLYRRDDLTDAKVVWVNEGEKCSDLTSGLGLASTSPANGAMAPRKSDWSAVAGKDVNVLLDHDEAGEAFGLTVASIVTALNPPARVKLIRLPLEGKGDDIEQWLQQMPDGWGPDECRAELERLAAETDEWAESTIVPETESDSATTQEAISPTFKDVEPRPLTPDLMSVPEMTPEMIPEVFREWLKDIADRGCFPIEYVAATLIVTLGGLIGRKLAIKPKKYDDWIAVPNLWGAIVGPPGFLKSPAVEAVMRPLKRLAADARDKHAQKLTDQCEKQLISAAKRKAAKSGLEKAAGKKDVCEVELAALAKEAMKADEEAAPVCKRYLVNDFTVEKLGELLAENPNGLTIFRDELAGLLNMMERDGHQNDRTYLLEGWDGNKDTSSDRIARGSSFVPAVCLSLFGTIQPGPLAKYMKGTISGVEADGFVPRFQLMVYPDPPAKFVYVDRWPNNDAKNDAYEIFKGIDQLDPETKGCELDENQGLRFVRFDDKAQIFFETWYTDLQIRLRSGTVPNLMATHLMKYGSLMPSLALIFHLVSRVTFDVIGNVGIKEAKLAAAWCDLLEAHAQRVYTSCVDGDVSTAVTLAERIKESLPNPFTIREVQRKGWAGLRLNDDVRSAIDILEGRGWVEIVEVPSSDELGRGRASEQVWVNPKVMTSQDEVSA